MLCLVTGSMFINITKFSEMTTGIQVFPTLQKFTLYYLAFFTRDLHFSYKPKFSSDLLVKSSTNVGLSYAKQFNANFQNVGNILCFTPFQLMKSSIGTFHSQIAGVGDLYLKKHVINSGSNLVSPERQGRVSSS